MYWIPVHNVARFVAFDLHSSTSELKWNNVKEIEVKTIGFMWFTFILHLCEKVCISMVFGWERVPLFYNLLTSIPTVSLFFFLFFFNNTDNRSLILNYTHTDIHPLATIFNHEMMWNRPGLILVQCFKPVYCSAIWYHWKLNNDVFYNKDKHSNRTTFWKHPKGGGGETVLASKPGLGRCVSASVA